MDAKIEFRDEVMVIHLRGLIDFEAADLFRAKAEQNWQGKKIVFNLEALHFVGSRGIKPFMDAVLDLGRSSIGKIKMCGLKSEFRRLFEANSQGEIEIFEDQPLAILSFTRMPEIDDSSSSSIL